MPPAFARPCGYPGCGAVIRGASSRCPAHPAAPRPRSGPKNFAARGGSGWQWTKVRARVFARDGEHCVLCGAPLALRTARIDHVVPISAGGGGEDANLRTLCLPCHRRVTPRGGG